MNKFEFSNVSKIWSFNMKNNRKLLIGWGIAIFSIMFLYMILFSSMQDIAAVKMESMPKELLEIMGISSLNDMTNFVSYFGMIYGIILIAISIFSVNFSSSLLSKEERSGSIEFLSTLYVNRTEIYLGKFLAVFSGTLIVVICASVSSIICGFINGGDTFKLFDVITIIKITSFTPFFFGAIAFMISGISAKLGKGTISYIIVFLSYMLGYLGQLLEDKGEFLKYFSPFNCFNASSAIPLESTTIIQLSIYFLVFIGAVVIGCIVYNKRDYSL